MAHPHRNLRNDYQDEPATRVDQRKGSAPRKLPAFVPAETVMPTVSYRAPVVHAPVAAPLPPPAPVQQKFVPVVEEYSVIEQLPRAPRATPPEVQVAQTAPRGELTVVFGCRGGAGSTTLAVNTAAMLARGAKSVCLVDLDLQLGDVCVALDLEPQTSLSAVAREAHALDAASLRRRLVQHGSGVCALTQAGHVEDLDPALPARLPLLLDTLRGHFDHVVVDGVRDFGDVSLAALEQATRILVVVTQDVASVRRAARVLTLLARLGIADGRCALVVNRAVRRAAIDDASIERALGMKIAARVREDGRVGEALDAGALLVDVARSRPIATDLATVATLCKTKEAPRTSTPRRGLFGWLRRKEGV
ncbi:MAG: AAA family ATPase [Deltaproteobacteria bacterium]|nr:AAA family ATPase [Deltaproteobacteria bacterium]